MSASAEHFVRELNFQVGLPGQTDVSTESREAESSDTRLESAGLLAGAASLYVFLVASLLWWAPAWMVILAPFVQVGVGRSLDCYMGDEPVG